MIYKTCALLFILLGLSHFIDGLKVEMTLSERVQQLSDAAAKKPIVHLNSEKFRQLVKGTPRNYSMVVMFTALAPSRQCDVCRHAADEYSLLGNSWRYSPSFSNKIFFGILDFDEGSEIFQQMKLNSAPVFMHFPAKGRPKKVDTFDLQRVGFSAETIARWVAERTDIQVRVFRPPNYTGLAVLLMLLAVVVGLLYLRKNNLEFLHNTTTWGLIAVGFVFVMTSGQMWNHIRGPPFMQKTKNGNIAYIHGSTQGQFVVETYIVAMLYACVTAGMILLTDSGASKEDGSKRRIMAVIGLLLVAVFFSLVLSIFRTKASGYPYSFLFK